MYTHMYTREPMEVEGFDFHSFSAPSQGASLQGCGGGGGNKTDYTIEMHC